MTAQRIGVAALRLGAVLVSAYVFGVWIATIHRSAAPQDTVRLDWYAHYQAGRRFVAGAHHAIYPTADMTDLWMYPPYCLYPAALLGLLPESLAYPVCAIAALGSLLVALALVAVSCPGGVDRKITAACVVAASMPFTLTVILGQMSGALALIVAVALFAWTRGREFLAGMGLSLLMAKPNFGLAIPFLCIVAGRWRVVTGFVAGFVVLLTTTLPLGVDVWTSYYDATRAFASFIVHDVPMWKHTTLYAFFRTFPLFADIPSATLGVIWAVAASLLTLLVAAAWRVGWCAEKPFVPRLVGLAVLLMLAAGPYAYFYDAILLLIPAFAWYGSIRDVWTVRDSAVAVCVVGVLVAGYATVLVWKGGTAWTGAFVSVWLVVEAWGVLAAERADSGPLGDAIALGGW